MSYQELWHRLSVTYDEGEAKAIARMVYEVRYGLSLSDLLMGRDAEVPQDELEQMAQRLERHEPVQYVLGVAEFCGHTYEVNSSVLIPRPETAELCQWIVETAGEQSADNGCTMVDIGTGSGCIAITLAAAIPQAAVSAWDISAEALETAQRNATHNGVSIDFRQVDALRLAESDTYPELQSQQWSCIVSNPPYIAHEERYSMEPNVLNYEPHTALFVPDEDALVFYRAIAHYGQTALKPRGWLFFEINPRYAAELKQMLQQMTYQDVEVRQDQYGKQRMIRARR